MLHDDGGTTAAAGAAITKEEFMLSVFVTVYPHPVLPRKLKNVIKKIVQKWQNVV